MNPFYAAACLLMIGAAAWAFAHGNPLSGGIAACYAAANALLTFIES